MQCLLDKLFTSCGAAMRRLHGRKLSFLPGAGSKLVGEEEEEEQTGLLPLCSLQVSSSLDAQRKWEF